MRVKENPMLIQLFRQLQILEEIATRQEDVMGDYGRTIYYDSNAGILNQAVIKVGKMFLIF